jgi:hypothetical protein
MVECVVYGRYQVAQLGPSLKYGVVVDRAVAHVAVNKHKVVAAQVHMPVKLFV